MLIKSPVLYVVLRALLHWVPRWPRFEHVRIGNLSVRACIIGSITVVDYD